MFTFFAVVVLIVLLALALVVALWINKRKPFTYTGSIPTKPTITYRVSNIVAPPVPTAMVPNTTPTPVGFTAPAPEQFTAPPLPGRNYIGAQQP